MTCHNMAHIMTRHDMHGMLAYGMVCYNTVATVVVIPVSIMVFAVLPPNALCQASVYTKQYPLGNILRKGTVSVGGGA